MPATTDLAGETIAGWRVLEADKPINRVRFWKVIHEVCGTPRTLPHTILMDLRAGKGEQPPCCGAACATGDTYDPGTFPAGQHAAAVLEANGKAGNAMEVFNNWTKAVDPAAAGVPWRTVARGDGWAIPDMNHVEPLGIPAPAVPEPSEPKFQAGLASVTVKFQVDPEKITVTPAPSHESVADHGKADGVAAAQDLLAVVTAAATQAPRPRSRELPGHSTLGTPCDRKLAARILEGSGDRGPAWRPYVGTAVHAALAEFLSEPVCDGADGAPRWLSETAVACGGSRGYVDVFDQGTGTVIDFKVTGVTKLRETARGKILPVYQGQLDLNGLGLTLDGHTVRTVAILALPMAGELEDAAWYSRPWDPDNAHRLISRGWRVRGEALAGRPLSSFAVAEDSCAYCPLLRRGDCQGVGSAAAPPKAPPITWGGAPASAPPF